MNQILCFQQCFAKPVKRGEKLQSIRPDSPYRAKLKPGDTAHLRSWKGIARRSPQSHLGEGVVKETFRLWWSGLSFCHKRSRKTELSFTEAEPLAKADGFSGPWKMEEWFRERYKKARWMRVIRWRLKK